MLGFLLGLSFSLLELAFDLEREKAKIDQSMQALLSLVTEPAITAAYEVDTNLAASVVKGLFSNPAVYRAVIQDDFANVLAERTRPRSASQAAWLADLFFGEDRGYTVSLTMPKRTINVGTLTMFVDSRAIGSAFFDRAYFALASTMLSSFLFAVILYALFYVATARPLLQTVDELGWVNPVDPDPDLLSAPKGHRDDEYGLLVSRIRDLLRGLKLSLDDWRRTDEALRQAEARSRLILESLPITGLISRARDGKILYANPRAAAEFGLSIGQLMGRSIAEFYPEAGRDGSLIAELVERRQIDNREVTTLRPDGKMLTGLITMRPIVFDGEEALISTAVDITDRKATEDELRRSRERFEKAFHSSPSMMSIVDLESGVIDEVNHQWLGSLGYERSDVIGQAGGELNLWEKRDEQARLVERIRNDGFIRDYPVRLRRRDGRLLDCVLFADTIEFGGRLRLLVVAHDISERVRAEAQRRQAHKMEALGQLSGGIAHDFNNILTIILFNLEITKAALGDGLDRHCRELIGDALSAGQQGKELIDRLFLFARPRALCEQDVELRHVLEQSAALLGRALGSQVALRLHLPQDSDACLAYVDPAQLQSALINLAVNARDARPRDGKIELTLGRVKRATLEPCAQSAPDVRWLGELCHDQYLEITLEDRGTGMPPEILERIADPFFTTKRHGEGTGLGFTMVTNFVQRSDGCLRVQSRPGIGTTVSLYLPVSSGAPFQAAEKESHGMPGGPETVLLVDDDPRIRRAVSLFLGGLGYRILEAESARDALDVLDGQSRAGESVDLVFTDIMMPGGADGNDLTRAIEDRFPGLPVIRATGARPQDDHAQAGAAAPGDANRCPGASAILHKPYSRPLLAQRIRQALDGRSRNTR